jgi:hypothetical protein
MKLLDLLTPDGFHIHINPVHVIHIQGASTGNTVIHFATSSINKEGSTPYSITVKHSLKDILDKLAKI